MISAYLEKIQYTPEDLVDYKSVGAVILNDEKKVLMMDHVKYGFWTLPIGKAKPDETYEEGLINEVKEELNIKITKFELLSSFDKTYPRPGGHKILAKAKLFLVLSYTGKLKNNEPHKHRSIKFMSIKEIKKLPRTSDMTKKFLSLIDRGKISEENF